MTQPVTIYSKDYCPYCKRAKALLNAKGVEFKDYDIVDDAEKTAEMIQRSGGRRTVPQIFIGTRHIGGASDLFELEASGKLDALLGVLEGLPA